MVVAKFWNDTTPQAMLTAFEAIDDAIAALDLTDAQTDLTTVQTHLSSIATNLTTIATNIAALDLTDAQTDVSSIVTEIDETGKLLYGDSSKGLQGILKVMGYFFKDQKNAKTTIFEETEKQVEFIGTFFDWLNTLITKGLAKEGGKALEEFDEKMSDFAREAIDRLFSNISDGEGDFSTIAGLVKGNIKGQGIKGILDLATAGVSGIIGMLPGFNKLQEGSNQILANKLKITIPDLELLMRSFWRNFDPVKIRTYLDKLGYSEDAIKIIDRGMSPQVGLSDLAKVRGIFDWNDETEARLVQALGYSAIPDKAGFPAQSTLAKQLLEIKPELPDLMELLRRGEITPEDFGKQTAFYGHKPPAQELYKQLALRLPSFDMLFEMARRGLIPLEKVQAELAKLGYDPDILKALPGIQWRKFEPETLRQAYFRGLIPKDEFTRRAGTLGYTPEDANILEETSWVLPPPQDIVRFGVREVFTPEIARKFRQFEDYPPQLTEWGNKIGMSEDVLKLYWGAHWDLPAPGQGFDMFHRGIISQDELNTLMRALDIMPFWRDKMMDLTFRLIPRRTLPRLRRQELITEGDLQTRFQKLGYPEQDAKILAASATLDAEKSRPKLTRAELQDAYAHDKLSKRLFEDALEAEGYDKKAIAYFFHKAELKKQKLDLAEETAAAGTAARKAKELTKSDILTGLEDGLIEQKEAIALLGELGYDETEITYYINKILFDIDRKSRLMLAKIQVKRFVELDVSESALLSKLVGLGFSAVEAGRQVTIAKQLRELNKDIDAEKERLPSRTDVTSWLQQRIIEVERWVEYMRDLGYTDESINYYLTDIVLETQLEEESG